MNVYLFHYIEHATSHYHPEGSVMVIAPTVERCKELIEAYASIEITEQEWAEVVVYKLADEPYTEKVYVFQDTGCC